MKEPGDGHDRLIHILLREIVGGESPPDVTGQVLHAVFGRRKRARWYAAGAAAAAIAVGLLASMSSGRYPAPHASGSYEIADGGSLRRGSVVVTQDEPALVALGGYCSIELGPGSALKIEGEPRAEQVLLERGAVACQVDPEIGSFAVHTAIGTVSVVGTRFAVQLIEETGQAAVLGTRMLVRVSDGAVSVSGDWGTASVRAGEEKLLPQGGVVCGILLEKSAGAVTLEGDGEKGPARYVFGEEMAGTIEQLFTGYEHTVVWREDEPGSRLVSIELVVPDDMRNFWSDDPEEVEKFLQPLGAKRDPRGRHAARKLLLSEKTNVWTAAAEYLALIGDEEVLPYLIKALEWHERRWCHRLSVALQSLVGRDFGTDAWIQRWRKRHPDMDLDSLSRSLQKHALDLSSTRFYPVYLVNDPTTILEHATRIRLIGIKLKEGADPEQAVTLLKTLVVNQRVQLEFDDGPKLTDDRARRACVFWLMSIDPDKDVTMRPGLPPVPFKTRTNINEYLLESGLYEADPAVDFGFVERKAEETALGLSSSYWYVVMYVVDPMTVLFRGARIRLIGVSLKKDADPEEAITVLKTAVVNQRLTLEFDDGPKLTEDGARRALVIWRSAGHPSWEKVMRRDLPPVPFKIRTPVNEHLLKSGLYEPDPEVDAAVVEELFALDLNNWYLDTVQDVIDPTTIRFLNSRIRLIGIKLKKDADPEQAVTLLKTLLMNQYVRLRFDEGPKVTEDIARRAFVFWIMPGDPELDAELRRGLPPVPFKTRTNINEYLLESGLYDVDPDVDFDSVGRQVDEETLDLNEDLYYIVHHVWDPTTVLAHGRRLRLIGIKLKEGAHPEQAVALLRTLLINQSVCLAFDDGPKLTMDGARRAFMYWAGSGHDEPGHDEAFRRGLPEVPFEEKTLINRYLLGSGMYEIDPDTLHSKAMLEELEAAEIGDEGELQNR